MTRIIAGVAKGRALKVPTGATRPTSDRVRESIFNVLNSEFGSWSGKRVLDLFAGSGALALEAMSRGAASAIAVDKAYSACEIMKHNSELAKLPLTVIQKDVLKYLHSLNDGKFDVVFLDPPYDVKNDVITNILDEILVKEILSTDAVVIVERSARDAAFLLPDSLTLHSERTLGETRVFVLLG